MPRMSKAMKKEMAFFINDKGRITHNDLCRKCIYDCKQSFRAMIVCCSKYVSKRAVRN